MYRGKEPEDRTHVLGQQGDVAAIMSALDIMVVSSR
jgi:hypothetical protein